MGMDEKVLCVPTARVWASGKTVACFDNLYESVTNLEYDFRFIERSICESDESLQQLIPYMIVKRRGRVLLYDRGSKGGESRLSGKLSVGIGGHINDGDLSGTWSLRDTVHRGAMRELMEETGLSERKYYEVSLIREIDTAVGRVHTGIVMVVDSHDWEPDQLDGMESDYAWVYPSMIIDHPRLESWSKMALKLLFPELSNTP